MDGRTRRSTEAQSLLPFAVNASNFEGSLAFCTRPGSRLNEFDTRTTAASEA